MNWLRRGERNTKNEAKKISWYPLRMTKAQVLDEKAKHLAQHLLQTEAQVLTTLMEMSRSRAFAELNYSGVYDYCLRRLGFSKEQSYYFKKVAEVSVTVPELKAAIAKGELSISTARRIAPILNRANQVEWIGKAKAMKQAELEKAVTEVNPQAHPRERIKPVAENVSELRVAIDDETDADLTVLKDLLSQKLRRAATLADVIAWAAKETREKFDPARKALRARKLSSGNAGKKKSVTSTGPGNAGQGAGVTSTIPSPLRPAPAAFPRRVPIPAAIRHEVVREQGVQCSFTSADNRRCEQRRWLDLHHRTPVAHGGGNHAQNLMLLCAQHHRAVHTPARK